MPRYVAFLRAINVGGRNVKMDRLREVFESLGFTNVETFIASGNVIFEWQDQDTRALERQIEARLLESLGYHVDTFIRSSQELADVIAYQPFPHAELESDETTLYISFLPETPGGDVQQRILDLQTPGRQTSYSRA